MRIVASEEDFKTLEHSSEFLNISSEGYDIQTYCTLFHRTLDKVLTLSKEDIQNPEVIGDLNEHIGEIAERSGLTPPADITSDMLIDPSVSQEGLGDMFMSFVKKILEWLTNVAKWITGLFKSSRITSKVQETAAKSAAKSIEQKINEVKKTKKTKTAISFEAPSKIAVIFHSRGHVPQIGYKYNDNNLSLAIKNVKKDMETFYDKLGKELKLLMDVANNALERAKEGKPIQGQDMKKLFTTKPLADLTHNGFGCMGFQLGTEPCKADNEFRDVRYTLSKKEEGILWSNEGTVTVSIPLEQIKSINDDIVNAIEYHNKERDKMLEFVVNANLVKRLDKTKKLIEDALLKGQLTEGQKAMALRYITSAQELANAAQILAASAELFTKNYTSILAQYLVVLDRGMTVDSEPKE